jgi:hypothetical protein
MQAHISPSYNIQFLFGDGPVLFSILTDLDAQEKIPEKSDGWVEN